MGSLYLCQGPAFFLLSYAALLLWTSQMDVITQCEARNSSLGNTSMNSGSSSALGDPGMKDQRVRVAIEAWNFCNKVGSSEGPSPRQADCTDIHCSSLAGQCMALHRVKEKDNMLRAGEAFPQRALQVFQDPDKYAIQKELYLAKLCQVRNPDSKVWNFWMIMLKNGNFDLKSGLCPSTFPSSSPKPFIYRPPSFPCFGEGCMNQPLIFHNWSTLHTVRHDHSEPQPSLAGSFFGTYDLDADVEAIDGNAGNNISYFSVKWEKNPDTGSWIFYHVLKVTKRYPWLMLYLRADATKGESGGYPYETRGMLIHVPNSPNFTVILTLNVSKGGGSESQFYLLDIGGCWKNNGKKCDGDVVNDVTRYSEMIINPETQNLCKASDYSHCPPFHITPNGTKIYRNDTTHFPYSAYHLYCVPANARFAEEPFHYCDPYSNPQPQELMQLLPHPEWGVHGYPSMKGEGWVGDARTWKLDVGALSSRLYFYQDPGTKPAWRVWTSLDVGTEIYISSQVEVAEWSVSDFDVQIH